MRYHVFSIAFSRYDIARTIAIWDCFYLAIAWRNSSLRKSRVTILYSRKDSLTFYAKENPLETSHRFPELSRRKRDQLRKGLLGSETCTLTHLEAYHLVSCWVNCRHGISSTKNIIFLPPPPSLFLSLENLVLRHFISTLFFFHMPIKCSQQ